MSTNPNFIKDLLNTPILTSAYGEQISFTHSGFEITLRGLFNYILDTPSFHKIENGKLPLLTKNILDFLEPFNYQKGSLQGTDLDTYSELKKKLRIVTLRSTFNSLNARRKSNCKSLTGIIDFEFDNLTLEQADIVIEYLKQKDNILAVTRTASYSGVMCMVVYELDFPYDVSKISDCDNYKYIFSSIGDDIFSDIGSLNITTTSSKHGVQPLNYDDNNGDATRCRYIVYDKDLYLNKNVKPYILSQKRYDRYVLQNTPITTAQCANVSSLTHIPQVINTKSKSYISVMGSSISKYMNEIIKASIDGTWDAEIGKDKRSYKLSIFDGEVNSSGKVKTYYNQSLLISYRCMAFLQCYDVDFVINILREELKKVEVLRGIEGKYVIPNAFIEGLRKAFSNEDFISFANKNNRFTYKERDDFNKIDYINEDIIDKLFKKCDESLNRLVIFDGPPGIGKSTAIMKFAHKVLRRTKECLIIVSPFKISRNNLIYRGMKENLLMGIDICNAKANEELNDTWCMQPNKILPIPVVVMSFAKFYGLFVEKKSSDKHELFYKQYDGYKFNIVIDEGHLLFENPIKYDFDSYKQYVKMLSWIIDNNDIRYNKILMSGTFSKFEKLLGSYTRYDKRFTKNSRKCKINFEYVENNIIDKMVYDIIYTNRRKRNLALVNNGSYIKEVSDKYKNFSYIASDSNIYVKNDKKNLHSFASKKSQIENFPTKDVLTTKSSEVALDFLDDFDNISCTGYNMYNNLQLFHRERYTHSVTLNNYLKLNTDCLDYINNVNYDLKNEIDYYIESSNYIIASHLKDIEIFKKYEDDDIKDMVIIRDELSENEIKLLNNKFINIDGEIYINYGFIASTYKAWERRYYRNNPHIYLYNLKKELLRIMNITGVSNNITKKYKKFLKLNTKKIITIYNILNDMRDIYNYSDIGTIVIDSRQLRDYMNEIEGKQNIEKDYDNVINGAIYKKMDLLYTLSEDENIYFKQKVENFLTSKYDVKKRCLLEFTDREFKDGVIGVDLQNIIDREVCDIIDEHIEKMKGLKLDITINGTIRHILSSQKSITDKNRYTYKVIKFYFDYIEQPYVTKKKVKDKTKYVTSNPKPQNNAPVASNKDEMIKDLTEKRKRREGLNLDDIKIIKKS